jgi:hypothetical protein
MSTNNELVFRWVAVDGFLEPQNEQQKEIDIG